MRTARICAALAFVLIIAIPAAASAVDWTEWKRLARKRPVAVLVVIPPLILTSPFMAVNWLMGNRGDDEDDE